MNASPVAWPRVTVAIPTYNRPELLRQTLQNVLQQDYPAGLWEILVVDNNSPPATRAVVESLQHASPAPRWILETIQGLNYARNRAIQESSSDVIVFADDDILAEPGWLRELVRPFGWPAESRVAAVGGTVIPVFPEGCPAWLEPYIQPQRFSDQTRGLSERENPMGANLAFRRTVFDTLGKFSADLDRKGATLLAGGETEMLRRLRSHGYEVWFAPEAVVRHQMPASRLTLNYACRNAFGSARSKVLTVLSDAGLSWEARFWYALSRLCANAVAAPLWLLLGGTAALLGRCDQARICLVRLCRCCGYLRQISRVSVNPPWRENDKHPV